MKRDAKRKAPKGSEKEFVKETIEAETGVHFEVIPPHPGFPLPVERLDWFMRCRNKEEVAKAPYLNTAWKERGDGIWFESLAVGDTVDWIELAYGDEKAAASLDLDYSRLGDPSFQEELTRRFPIVMERISEYEKTAVDVSRRSGVHLELRRAGSKGMLVFTMAARVKSPGSATRALGNAVKRSVSALREAYALVENL